MKRWYVVQTQPRKERLAEHHLRNQDFVTFCPARPRTRGAGSRTQSVLAPFFPGYLFIELDVARQRWRSVNGTIGVLRLVSFGSSPAALPAPLPEGLVERFRHLSAPDGSMPFDDRFAPGDRVRIMDGPFEDLCGTLESAGDKERVIILLEFLARKTRVEIERGRLIAA